MTGSEANQIDKTRPGVFSLYVSIPTDAIPFLFHYVHRRKQRKTFIGRTPTSLPRG